MVLRQTANVKRQNWNFCRLSLALWTVEWKYLYLWRIVGDIFFIFMWFNEGLEEKNTNSGHLCRLPFDLRPPNVKLSLSTGRGMTQEWRHLTHKEHLGHFHWTDSRFRPGPCPEWWKRCWRYGNPLVSMADQQHWRFGFPRLTSVNALRVVVVHTNIAE